MFTLAQEGGCTRKRKVRWCEVHIRKYDQLEALWRCMGVDEAGRLCREIESLCEKFMAAADEQNAFVFFADGEHTEELLSQHEYETACLKMTSRRIPTFEYSVTFSTSRKGLNARWKLSPPPSSHSQCTFRAFPLEDHAGTCLFGVIIGLKLHASDIIHVRQSLSCGGPGLVVPFQCWATGHSHEISRGIVGFQQCWFGYYHTYCSNISPYYTSERTCIISHMIWASKPWAKGRYILDYDGWAGSVIIPDGDGVDEWADGHEYSIDGWAEVVGYYVDGFTKVDVYQIARWVGRGSGEIFIIYMGGLRER
ncbi:uncharacterized protein EDB91DRAFT_1087565 [Suillus paluster]|uniref:uncharacterized protein n=1 Tax=Suillus paluster TaxID=48578 RepID=UPI001B873FD9|nr:uncharacterized protein EDB91DRAFT_1087565 [Suillus paluster]KAG1724143.1 hypothetical protein EDB91DRAFT_1087565 [Suillus paluster]